MERLWRETASNKIQTTTYYLSTRLRADKYLRETMFFFFCVGEEVFFLSKSAYASHGYVHCTIQCHCYSVVCLVVVHIYYVVCFCFCFCYVQILRYFVCVCVFSLWFSYIERSSLTVVMSHFTQLDKRSCSLTVESKKKSKTAIYWII